VDTAGQFERLWAENILPKFMKTDSKNPKITIKNWILICERLISSASDLNHVAGKVSLRELDLFDDNYIREQINMLDVTLPSEWLHRANYTRNNVHEINLIRIRELMKYLETTNRKNESKWRRIYNEIANERGPWGYGGNNNQKDVFWALDNNETSLRLKLRLKRNAFGTIFLFLN
jgi:predicted molibdopterin-dependent oxidoreductase YjgC